MARLKLSKSGLAEERARLDLCKRTLPSLDLKRRQLTVELAKARRALEEARAANDPAAIEEELGDLLFSTVNLARHLGVDPEVALQATNRKFIDRFEFVKNQLEIRGHSFEASNMEEMEELKMLEVLADYHGFSKSGTIRNLVKKEFWRVFPGGTGDIRPAPGAKVTGEDSR